MPVLSLIFWLFPISGTPWLEKKGVILSGGQQHRLAMARAYAAKHNVLILDDVLSSVDHDTEQQMIDALFNEEHPPTTIIIAHRISALQHCDHIIVLEDGCIRNEGRHDDLILMDGPYKATWQYQQLEASLNE